MDASHFQVGAFHLLGCVLWVHVSICYHHAIACPEPWRDAQYYASSYMALFGGDERYLKGHLAFVSHRRMSLAAQYVSLSFPARSDGTGGCNRACFDDSACATVGK